MTKWDSMPTAKARQMISLGVCRKEISEKTGLKRETVRSIASRMRKSGINIPIEQKRYEYTGTSRRGHVIKFRSLRDGAAMGFKGEFVSMCVNGKKKSYVGYTWARKEI